MNVSNMEKRYRKKIIIIIITFSLSVPSSLRSSLFFSFPGASIVGREVWKIYSRPHRSADLRASSPACITGPSTVSGSLLSANNWGICASKLKIHSTLFHDRTWHKLDPNKKHDGKCQAWIFRNTITPVNTFILFKSYPFATFTSKYGKAKLFKHIYNVFFNTQASNKKRKWINICYCNVTKSFTTYLSNISKNQHSKPNSNTASIQHKRKTVPVNDSLGFCQSDKEAINKRYKHVFQIWHHHHLRLSQGTLRHTQKAVVIYFRTRVKFNVHISIRY